MYLGVQWGRETRTEEKVGQTELGQETSGARNPVLWGSLWAIPCDLFGVISVLMGKARTRLAQSTAKEGGKII